MTSRLFALSALAATLLGFNMVALWGGAVVLGSYLFFSALLGVGAFALALECRRTGRPRPLATAVYVVVVGHLPIQGQYQFDSNVGHGSAGLAQGILVSQFCLLALCLSFRRFRFFSSPQR